MNSSLKLTSLLVLAGFAATASALTDEENAAPGFYTCAVKNEAADTMYITAATFAGKRGDDKQLAQGFADAVLKVHPEAGSLGYPMCNFGFEEKYAVMYLDTLKSQFTGDVEPVAFTP